VELLAQQYYSSLGIPAPRPIFVGDRLWYNSIRKVTVTFFIPFRAQYRYLKKLFLYTTCFLKYVFTGFSITRDNRNRQCHCFHIIYHRCHYLQHYLAFNHCPVIYRWDNKRPFFKIYQVVISPTLLKDWTLGIIIRNHKWDQYLIP